MSAGRLIASVQTRLVTGVARHACGPEWAHGGRQTFNDPFSRLYGLRAGEAEVEHHGQTFSLRPGGLFVIPAHTPSRYCCPRSMSLTWLHFTAHLYGSLEPFACLGWPFAIKAGRDACGQLEEIIHLMEEDSPAALLRADGLLRQLLARFAAAAPASAQESEMRRLGRLQPVLTHIEHNLARPLPLAELADVAHLHPTYFSNRFAKHMGVPPVQYINRRRVERAAGLLFQTEALVEEIARAVGFRDVYYFSKVFKRFMGLPPTQYRAQIRVEA